MFTQKHDFFFFFNGIGCEMTFDMNYQLNGNVGNKFIDTDLLVQ